MGKLIAKDDVDYAIPLLIAFSGWMVLVGFLYYRYIQYDQDVFALILSSGESASAQHVVFVFLSPLMSGILGYAVNRRLLLYRTKYLNECHFKNLAEKELVELVNNIIISFVNALDAKSTWTKGHSLRVRHYSLMLASELGVTGEDLYLLGISSLLHDIGKIGTYDDILNKVETLSEEEFELIKKHPGNAVNILDPIKEFRAMLPIIKSHHERMDGRGYPDGLSGEDIPFLGRILCVADSYDAIISERPYKLQMSEEEGVREIQVKAGTQFDPMVVAALTAIYDSPEFRQGQTLTL